MSYLAFQFYVLVTLTCKKPEQDTWTVQKETITMHTHKKVDSAAHAIFFVLIRDDETVLQQSFH
jgi:hypothetical protein